MARIAASIARIEGEEDAGQGDFPRGDGGDADDRAAERQADKRAAERDAAEGLLRRTVAWFGCYLVWPGPYPSPPADGPEHRRAGPCLREGSEKSGGRAVTRSGGPSAVRSREGAAGSDGAEDADGDGGWAAERILVRHLRGRTAPKVLRAGPPRAETPPGHDPGHGVRCAEQ